MSKLPDLGRRGRSVLLVGAVTVCALAAGTVPASAGSTGPTKPRAAVTTSAVPAPSVASGQPPMPPPSATAAPDAPLQLAPGVSSNTPPEPHVITTFADGLKGPRRGSPPGRALTVPVAPDVDGCDRNYGESSQCVPKTLPGGQTDVCAYLDQRGIKGVRVKGGDTRALDRNRNGVVCD